MNAYTLLSPNTYYSPRGFPDDLIADDARGKGANAPELIRIGLATDESKSVAVIQSSIDGFPDARYDPLQREQNYHAAFLHAVVLPPDVLHPCNRVATLHRYDALWALFSPPSIVSAISDVVRGYVAQAIFPLIGRHVAIVRPIVVRENMHGLEIHDGGWHLRLTLPQLIKWRDRIQSGCTTSSPQANDCKDVGTLLLSAYGYMERANILTRSDVDGVTRWVGQLQSAGYVFPASRRTNIKTSPRRSRTHNVHAAVHINNGNAFEGIVPLYHAVHGAQFTQITYHVQRVTNTTYRRPFAGVYRDSVYFMENLPGVVTGYTAYDTAVQAWKVHDESTDAMLWMHEDAFTTDAFIDEWLHNTTACVAVPKRDQSNMHGDLPTNVSMWNSSSSWYWANILRTQFAANHFLETVTARNQRCVGIDFATRGYTIGQSDVFGIQSRCKSLAPDLFFDLLQAASESGFF